MITIPPASLFAKLLPSPDQFAQTAARLLSRPGGVKSILALLLFQFNDVFPDGTPLLDLGICLRERDLSYFGFEEFDGITVSCVPFEGEIPVVYSITRNDKNVPRTNSDLPPSFFAFVDFISATTGSGVVIPRADSENAQSVASSLATDLQTGRRVRYRFTKSSKRWSDAPLYLVERTEAGRTDNYDVVT